MYYSYFVEKLYMGLDTWDTSTQDLEMSMEGFFSPEL